MEKTATCYSYRRDTNGHIDTDGGFRWWRESTAQQCAEHSAHQDGTERQSRDAAEEVGESAQRATSRFSIGVRGGFATKNLLAGLATCGECGGGMVVETSPRKRLRVAEYVCYRHRHYDTCANGPHTPVAEMNEAVLQTIEQHVLTPEAIEQVIAVQRA
jgi:hypothetical protein